MGEESFDDISANIAACLTSSKRQVSVSELNRDYLSILGETIPYRKCGFNSLEDLIRALPNVKLSRVGNEIFVEAKPDEKTAHIVNLVKNQKSSKKKSKGGGRYGTYKKPPQRKPSNNYSSSYRSSSYKSSGYSSSRTSNSYSSGGYNSESSSYQTARSSYNTHANNNSNSQKVDWEQPDENDYLRRYRSSKPCELDFSDGDNEDFGEYDDEFLDDISPTRSDEHNALDNFTNLQITLDEGRQVSDRKTNGVSKYRSSKSNSQEDDVGYSSMNEVSSLSQGSTHEIIQKKGTKSEKSAKSKAQLRGPAAIVAAGRAMKEPTSQEFSFNEQVHKPGTGASSPALIPEDPVVKTITQKPLLDDLSDPADFKLRSEPRQKDTSGIQPISFFTTATMKAGKSNKSGTKHSSSKMSDPNMYRAGPDHPPNYGESTFCGKLLMFTVKHNLPCPEFMNFNKFDPKTKHASYMCKVKIGEHLNFSSCPFASSLLQEAQEHVAEIAYQELCRRYEHMETVALPVVTDRQEIISRVTEIVSPHLAGLKSEAVEAKYKLMHQEKLPPDWLTIIKDLSLLSVEKLVGGYFVYPPEDGKVPPNVTKLPPLVLPETDQWAVFITCCLSTNSVYFRIIHDDYNGAYESMSEQMDEIYHSARDQLHPVDVVKEGNFYAAFLNGQWFRVKALSGVSGESVRVSLIDHGDTDDILKDVIYPLDERFVHLPAQAIRCGLHNLEQYYTDSYVSQTVYDEIIGQALMATVESRNPHLLLTLFNTNGDEDINCNKKIKEQIQTVLSPPKVPAKGNVKSVYLTSVQEDGHAYVQIVSECFKFLRSLMASVNGEMSKNEKNYVMKSVNELVGGKVFLAKYHGDGLWHRATVRSLIHDNQVEVMFVDYGNIEIVPLECLASIQHFTDVLGAIAYQAVEVQLVKPTSELFTQTIIEFLMGISQSGGDEDNSQRLFMMKVIKDDPVPDVELSLRLSDTNKVVTLNDIIGTYYPEYRSLTFKGIDQSSDILERLPQIKPFAVPSEGVPFNVYVFMVSHPTHFIVQPLEYRERLQSLAEKMKQYYQKEKPVVDVTMITVGQAFAVERSDGKWCRGIVTLVMPDLNSVSVKFIDYGDTLSVNYQNLYVLLPCFRELPAMAIKAELAGIRPIHCDWNMNDSIRFKDLVAHKSFVAVPVEVNENSVSMILLDTSTEKQIDIGAVLVDEGRAKDITVYDP